MSKRSDTSLTPRAMREVAETDWTNVGSGGSVSRTEEHAKRLFTQFVAPLYESHDPNADERAREWTVGALTAAFPKADRADVRPKVRTLVERVTEQLAKDAVLSRETDVEQKRMRQASGQKTRKNNRDFRVGDKVVIERFHGHACSAKDKPISSYEATIARETPKRWALGPPHNTHWIDKRTNVVKPTYINYLDRARLADGA